MFSQRNNPYCEFHQILFGDFRKSIYLCTIKFDGTHNKDYSVVKTFKAGLSVSLFLCLFHTHKGNQSFRSLQIYLLCFLQIQKFFQSIISIVIIILNSPPHSNLHPTCTEVNSHFHTSNLQSCASQKQNQNLFSESYFFY